LGRMTIRIHVYVDGFNLYYGAVKDTPYRWLDLQRFFALLRPHDDVRVIHYFTALIEGPHASHQETYLRALATLPKINVVLGRFKPKSVKCQVAACEHKGSRIFRMPEEKQTDVLIAVTMIRDAYENACEGFVLVSGDTDLVPAVKAVKSISKESKAIVYVPAREIYPDSPSPRGFAVELRTAADKARILPNQLIKRAQFPNTISDGFGGIIHKPPSW